MTGNEKLRKENQAFRKEIQDLKNQLKKITNGMSQAQRRTGQKKTREIFLLLQFICLIISPLVCYVVLSFILRFLFHIFLNCKLSLVKSLSLYFLYFARIVPSRIASLAFFAGLRVYVITYKFDCFYNKYRNGGFAFSPG